MLESTETLVTGGFLGVIAMIAGKAVTFWLRAIHEQMAESNKRLVELTTMFAKYNTSNEIEHAEFRRQLVEHAELHRQHDADLRRAGIRKDGSIGAVGPAGSTP